MKRTFIYNIRSSIIQFVVNQGVGVLIFYVLSRYLDKPAFGEINWTLAVYFAFFSILPLGMDQVIVQKIAAAGPSTPLPGYYRLHVLVTGIIFYGLIICCSFIFPSFFSYHPLLLIIGMGKLLFYFSTPFKQIVSGLEKFNVLLYMSIVSNGVKLLAIVWLAVDGGLTITRIVWVFVLADCLELLACLLLYRGIGRSFDLLRFNAKEYRRFIRDCLPQAGVAVFSSALSRLDWILIGVFLTAGSLAEYSFAYKVFEVSTLPLLVIAPLLVPLFTRNAKEGRPLLNNPKILLLLQFELIIAGLTALALNILWIPLIEPLTHGRYGTVNAPVILLLSVAIPLLYLNNFLWSIHFSEGRMKMILKVFACTFLVNLVLNAILIPYMGNKGAALAYLISILLQTVLYSVNLTGAPRLGWCTLLLCSVAAISSGWLAGMIFHSSWAALCFAITFYMLLLLVSTGLAGRDWKKLRTQLIKKSNP